MLKHIKNEDPMIQSYGEDKISISYMVEIKYDKDKCSGVYLRERPKGKLIKLVHYGDVFKHKGEEDNYFIVEKDGKNLFVNKDYATLMQVF